MGKWWDIKVIKKGKEEKVMDFKADLTDLKTKFDELVGKVETAAPGVEQELFDVVEKFFLDKGYSKPVVDAVETAVETAV